MCSKLIILILIPFYKLITTELLNQSKNQVKTSTKISTAKTTLKRKIEGISYNVAQSSTANQDLHDETSTKIRKKK